MSLNIEKRFVDCITEKTPLCVIQKIEVKQRDSEWLRIKMSKCIASKYKQKEKSVANLISKVSLAHAKYNKTNGIS